MITWRRASKCHLESDCGRYTVSRARCTAGLRFTAWWVAELGVTRKAYQGRKRGWVDVPVVYRRVELLGTYATAPEARELAEQHQADLESAQSVAAVAAA